MKHLAQKSFPLPHRPKLPPKTTSSRILPHQSHSFLLPQPPTPADIEPPVPEGMGSWQHGMTGIHHFHSQIANQKHRQSEDGKFRGSYDRRQASEHRK